MSCPRPRQGGVAQGLCLAQSSGYLAPRAVPQDLVDRCRQSVHAHCTFSHELLELRQWMAMVTQKLESHLGDAGSWDAQSREVEVEVSWLSSQRFQCPPLHHPQKQAGEAKAAILGCRDPFPRTSLSHSVCPCLCVCACLCVCPSEAAG